MPKEFAYRGGIDAILFKMERFKFQQFEGADAYLIDLSHQDLSRYLSENAPLDAPSPPKGYLTIEQKQMQLFHEFAGQPKLLALHGLLIAISRRTPCPDLALTLYFRLWSEHKAFLLQHLDDRWKVSAIKTLASHGETEAQRAGALQFSTFYDLSKLYESERRHSGYRANAPFLDQPAKGPLPLSMKPFSLIRGDLDLHFIAQLWKALQKDPLLADLAAPFVEEALTQKRGLFFRVSRMRRHNNVQPAAHRQGKLHRLRTRVFNLT